MYITTQRRPFVPKLARTKTSKKRYRGTQNSASRKKGKIRSVAGLVQSWLILEKSQ
jgi:hypothetical protein